MSSLAGLTPNVMCIYYVIEAIRRLTKLNKI